VVYQAFNESIGRYAVTHKKFGDNYSFTRMSWIKTNFLWMMFRSDWGCSANQEVILAIWVKRAEFENILANVVHSTYKPQYGTENDWKKAVSNSEVRLQWDPDHSPKGGKLIRRALQLGLKGETLKNFAAGGAIIDIQDITEFVDSQRNLAKGGIYDKLKVPHERIYTPSNQEIIDRLQLAKINIS